jgi:hypothetical protein
LNEIKSRPTRQQNNSNKINMQVDIDTRECSKENVKGLYYMLGVDGEVWRWVSLGLGFFRYVDLILV